MSKIFISLFNGGIRDKNNEYAFPLFYETIINELSNLGNELFVNIVSDFNINFEEIQQELLDRIRDFNPDLFILFNNSFYDISKEFDCPILIYEVDSPKFYCNKEKLKQNIDRYKFVVVQDISKEVLINEFGAKNKNIIKLPFITGIRAKKMPIENNICFIGTKFAFTNIYNNFIKSQPTYEEKQEYLELINDYKKDVWIDVGTFWKKHNNISEKVKMFFKFDECLSNLSDFNRVKTLSSVSDLGLDLYGNTDWETFLYNEPELIFNYNKKIVYSVEHNENIYNSHKIGININHLQAKTAFSWRVCDIMASNACLVSEYKPDIKKYFDRIIPTFDNLYDARKICKELIENENHRNDIVLASQEVIDKNFRFKNILPMLESFSGVSFSLNKLGGSVIYNVMENIQYIEIKNRPRKIKLKYKIMKKIYDYFGKKLTRKGII